MICVSDTGSYPMVASITVPKESAKVEASTTDASAAIARTQHSRQSVLKRGCISTPHKETSTKKSAPSKPTYSSSLPSNYPRNNQTSPSLFNYQNLNVYVVGNVGHPKAQIVRVVHISDTRGVGDYYANCLPNGHILIHSGDFLDGPPLRHRTPLRRSHFRKSRIDEISSPTEECVWKTKLREIDEFFRRQPHPYKIFVSGCWDHLGPHRPSPEEIQKHLPSAIYLEDAACEILGLKVYGIPWTSADDLRPEDGKSHFTSSTGNSKVKAMLPHWLLRPSDSSSRSRRQSKRQRCLSSCTGTPAEPSPPVEASRERSAAWPAYRSTDTNTGHCSKAGVCESESSPLSTSCSSPSHSSTNSSTSSVSSSVLCDGFILPDIKAVEERYARVPSDTNIIVSHMPAWRPELYTHVVERVQPYLHLCGHDFTGYGVTWRSGVVFSNAAVQLTSTYPRVIPYYPFPRRRKAYSSTFSSGGVVGGSGSYGDKSSSIEGQDLFAGASAPSKVTEHGGALCLTGDVTTLPPRIPRFNDVGVRPRRWRRRLSSILGRLSLFLSTHSLTEGPHPLSSHYGRASSRIQPTPSSVAALRYGEGDFVVDPTLSVFGREAGGSGGGSRSGYVGRRNPLVFDVYVVIEEGVNDREVLPDYSKKPFPAPSENAPPEHQQSSSRALRKGTACRLQ
ncbi:hypothetical protein Aperf_G00000064974 [Anoplocephala perfoliata]